MDGLKEYRTVMIYLQLFLHEKREDWNLRNSMVLCPLCKRNEKTCRGRWQPMKDSPFFNTELLDLVTELKFAPFISARDKKNRPKRRKEH